MNPERVEETQDRTRLVNTRRTDGPSGNCVVVVIQIRCPKRHVSREYRISQGQGKESTARKKQKPEQAVAREPAHPQSVSDRELSIKKQPTGPHPSRPNDVLLEQLPLSELELSFLREGRREKLSCRSLPVERSWWAKCMSRGHLRLLEG